MPNRKIGTQEEWAGAHAKLLVREQEYKRLGDELTRQRQEHPWVPVEKDYRFETEDGPKTLAELFDGRSQLMIYHSCSDPPGMPAARFAHRLRTRSRHK